MDQEACEWQHCVTSRKIHDGMHVSNAAAELLSTTSSLTALITLLSPP